MDLFVDNYGKTMLEAAKRISTWTYGVTLFPKNVPVFKKFVDVFRMGNIDDVFVEREEVETSAKKLLSSIADGQVKKLVAGTGTGKSTVVPVSLAISTSGVGIVITPTRQLSKSLESYVRKNIAVGRYSKCKTVLAFDGDDLKKIAGSAVCYFSASDFLMMLAQDTKMFDTVPVSFIYVDEAHERIPQYAVIRYLVSAGVFSGTKLFMGSATSSDQNLERRGGNVSHKVVGVKPHHMCYDDVDSLTDKSPLYHNRISDRTLVFVPSSDNFSILASYYEQNALPVVLLPEYASSLDISIVNQFLSQGKRPAVVLLTAAHQTGFTFEAETVVDCSVTQEMNVDLKKKTVRITERAAYEYERVQRCGRVGRHMSGVAYHVDVVTETPEFELYPGSECYVALWCRLFSLRLKNPLMRQWAEFVESMSEYKICLLLCSTIHPVILSTFIDDEGDVAYGTRIVFLNFLRRQRKLVQTSSVIVPDLMTKTWQEQILVLPCVKFDFQEYRSEYLLPENWMLWAHNMFYLMYDHNLSNGAVAEGSFIDCGQTVASDMSQSGYSSVAVSERSTSVKKDREKTFGRTVSSGSIPNKVYSDGRTDASLFKESVKIGSLSKYSPEKDRRPTNISRKSEVRPPSYRSEGRAQLGSRDDGFSNLKITSGDDSARYRSKRDSLGSGSERSRRKQQRDSGIGGFQLPVDQAVVTLSKKLRHKSSVVMLDANKVGTSLLMPFDEELLFGFEAMEVNKSYYSIFRPFKHNEVMLSAMKKIDVQKYFFATLVTWNHAISALMQIQSVPESNLFSKSLKMVKIKKQEQSLERIRPLLQLFDAYQLFVTYKFKPQQGGMDSLGEYLKEIEMAEYARIWGAPMYDQIWKKRDRMVTSLYSDGNRVGGALKDGQNIITVNHIVAGGVAVPREFKNFPVTVVHRDIAKDFLMLTFARVGVSSLSIVKYRNPIFDENVAVFYPLVSKVIALGFFTICSVEDDFIYDANLPDGASGCPIVSFTDGCVVGIHKGVFPCRDGQVMSSFVPYQQLRCHEI